jgi:hypothetical protein
VKAGDLVTVATSNGARVGFVSYLSRSGNFTVTDRPHPPAQLVGLCFRGDEWITWIRGDDLNSKEAHALQVVQALSP